MGDGGAYRTKEELQYWMDHKDPIALLGKHLLKTRAADMNAYREFAGTVLWQLPGVRETRTYAVMEEVKNTTALAL